MASVINDGIFLEVGPGSAFMSIKIVKRIPLAQIIGLGIFETMISIGGQNVTEVSLPDRIRFMQSDTTEMLFDDVEFDFVVSIGSLYHWIKPVQFFNEIYRVLKPGQSASSQS
ncbi:class I SAM-dependent methyltransferase [Chloroflexota bacterium]